MPINVIFFTRVVGPRQTWDTFGLLAGDRPQRRIYAWQNQTTSALPLGPLSIISKWRHRDGSTIEFSPAGWTSNDPLNTDWLTKMSQLSSSVPSIPPVIRNWIREECELISFGEREYLRPVGTEVFEKEKSSHGL